MTGDGAYVSEEGLDDLIACLMRYRASMEEELETLSAPAVDETELDI
jgi:hypothetical protein